MLIWCDTETTGLKPKDDALLEVAIVVTDNGLNEVAAQSWVLPLAPDDPRRVNAHAVVQEMHAKNGLWDECAALADETLPGYVEVKVADILAFVRQYTEAKSGPICGSTIGFDRAFLEHHMPEVAAHFSHRNLDVSVFTELALRFYPEAYEKRPKGGGHRALPDIRASIEMLRYWRSTVLR